LKARNASAIKDALTSVRKYLQFNQVETLVLSFADVADMDIIPMDEFLPLWEVCLLERSTLHYVPLNPKE
jgi:hypothetical protein